MEMFLESLPVLVNFTALVTLLFLALRKPAAAFMANRSAQIGQQMVEAQAMSTDAERELNKWQTNWRSLEVNAKKMQDDAKSTLEKLRLNSAARAKVEAERIEREANLVGQSELNKAKLQLQREVAIRSVDLVEEYLGSHIGDEDRHRLVADYTKVVGNGHAG